MDEWVAYFKNNGFTRLMEGLYDLYVRHERCFGAARLSHPAPEEEKAISEFFKRDYYNQALIRISLADFERQARKVLSPNFTLAALLEAYFGGELIRRPGPQPANAFSLYVENEMTARYKGTEAGEWLREVATHVRRVYRKWADLYRHEPEKVEEMINTVCGALNRLPVKKRLSAFALETAGDVHALDAANNAGQLFVRALIKKYSAAHPVTPEEYSALYYKAGLLTDGALSYVTARGLTAYRDGFPDEAAGAYDKRNEPYMLTLENLDGITAVEAYGGKAFVMDNLSVFTAVSERTRNVKCTLICAAGGVNCAFTALLDKLNASGAALYYAGGMDYAGLCRADRVYLTYPQRFIPWRYGRDDYEKNLTENDFFPPDSKKDAGLHNETLASLLSLMRKRGKAAAQAGLVPDMAEDILKLTDAAGQGDDLYIPHDIRF